MKRLRQTSIGVMTVFLLFSSLAYGDAWTKNKRLTDNPGTSMEPAIAVDGLSIYVVWTNRKQHNYEMHFKRSVDGGESWTTEKRFTYNSADSYQPALAVNGSNIYAVWYDVTNSTAEIYFKRSVNGGAIWEKTKQLSSDGGYAYEPAIAVDGSKIYVVWTHSDGRNSRLHFKQSADGGATWEKDRLLPIDAGDLGEPTLTVNGSNIYVVWMDAKSGNYAIYCKRSVDGGNTWEADKQLTDGAVNNFSPILGVNGSNIYVAWSDGGGIYFRRSVDGGVTWKEYKRLTTTSDSSARPVQPAIAVNGSNIYVVWRMNALTAGSTEISFKHSFDGGVTWAAKKRLTNNAGISSSPALSVDGSNIHVVWQDDAPGNYEIFYKKGTLN